MSQPMKIVPTQPGGSSGSRPSSPGDGDGLAGCIDPGCLQSEAGDHERVFPGSAPNIQDTAPEGARFGQRQERGLGPTDVPGRRAGVEGVEIVGSPRPHGIGSGIIHIP